ncbi:MAG: FG-GAP-like repeat-containing protein [Candidatus Altiarchaeota archaeon]
MLDPKKILFILAVYFLSCTSSSQEYSDALIFRWGYNVGKGSEDFKGDINFLQVTDLDNDGKKEVIATTKGSIGTGKYELNNVVYAIRGNGTLYWKRPVDDILRSAFLNDFDRDGEIEIVVGAGRLIEELSRGRVYIIESDGTIQRTYSSSAIIQTIYVADLDNDRWSDIIGGSTSKLYLFDSFGLTRWDILLNDPIDLVLAADMTGDGYKDIIAVSDSLYLFNYNGSMILQKKVDDISNRKNDRISKVVIGKITPQREMEIVLGTEKSNTLYVLAPFLNYTTDAYQLAQRWTYPLGGDVTTLAVANLDLDENNEIIVGTSDDYVQAIDNDGRVLWVYELGGYANDVEVSDVNGDDHDDVVVGTMAGIVYVLTQDGKFQWKFDIDEPIIALDVEDLENDSLSEVILGTSDKSVYAYEVNISYTQRETANFYYQEAQRLYVNSDYNNSLEMLLKAKSIYIRIGDMTGIERIDKLIENINEKLTGLRLKQAEAFYSKAQEFFIAGDYEKSKQFALESQVIYDEFGDTQNVLRAEILIKRADNMIVSVPTTAPLTTLKPMEEKSSVSLNQVILVVVVVIVLVFLMRFIMKRRRYVKSMEESMKKYEHDLEKTLDEDMEDLGKMKTR